MERLDDLQAAGVQVLEVDVMRWLEAAPDKGFDIVFVDPPFDKDLQAGTLALLAENGWLAPAARVYVESSLKSLNVTPPRGWHELRSKNMGDVRLALYRAPG